MNTQELNASRTAEAALVQRIVAGDPVALERMMRQHNRRLFRVARSILRDDGEAEDAVQEGYIKAYQALPGFRGEAGLATWLTRIVVNQALERSRRRGPETDEIDGELIPAGESASPENGAIRAELRGLIERSIDRLPETYRTVFMLREVEGMDIAETAATLSITPGTVKIRLLRAKQKLRDHLGRQVGALIDDVFAFDGQRCDRLVHNVMARLGLSSRSPGRPKSDLAPTGGGSDRRDEPGAQLTSHSGR